MISLLFLAHKLIEFPLILCTIVIVHFFRVSTAAGTLQISMNPCGQLSSLKLMDGQGGVEGGSKPVFLFGVHHWIESLTGYLGRGIPLPPLDWAQVDDHGWTPFQREVYRVISGIPHGETRTYGWVAQRLRNSAATRAVGQALKKNPLPILIPCHRVVAADSLGGFMGASDPMAPELALKQKLIQLEEDYLNPRFSFLESQSA